MRAALTIFFLAAAFPASASSPPVIDVHLSNFHFTPQAITLEHGRDYVLRLTNDARGGHDFTAPEFLAAAVIDPADRKWVEDGEIEVPAHQTREIHFTAPRAGSYSLKCSHAFHKAFGMKGLIVVR